MILDGKCLEDFEKWIIENDYPISIWAFKEDKNYIHPAVVNALIIEWFDSVELHICVIPVYPIYIYGYSYSVDMNDCYEYWKTRQEATEQAIIKSNQIYNERYIN